MSYDPNQNGIDKSDYTKDTRAGQNSPPPKPPMPYSPYTPYGGYGTKKPSRFVIFILAFMPGLSHMYLGLIKRGLFYISAIALSVFLTVQFGISGLAPLIIITAFANFAICAVAFFEAFAIRRDIVMGKEVQDVIPSFVKNKTFLLAVAALLTLVVIINILSFIPWYFWILIAVAVIVVTASRKDSKK